MTLMRALNLDVFSSFTRFALETGLIHPKKNF